MPMIDVCLRFSGLVVFDPNSGSVMPKIVFPTRTDSGGYSHENGHSDPHRLMVVRRLANWSMVPLFGLPSCDFGVSLQTASPLAAPTLAFVQNVQALVPLYGAGNAPKVRQDYGEASTLLLSQGQLDASDASYELATVKILHDPSGAGPQTKAVSVHASFQLTSGAVAITAAGVTHSLTLAQGEALEFANSPALLSVGHGAHPNPDFEFFYSIFDRIPKTPVPVSVIQSMPPDPAPLLDPPAPRAPFLSPGIRCVPVARIV